MTIDAFRGRQCHPFLAVLATVLFLTAPVFAQDASYLETGDSNFNNPANWTGGAVPKGTATIALENRNTPITFAAPLRASLANLEESQYPAGEDTMDRPSAPCRFRNTPPATSPPTPV